MVVRDWGFLKLENNQKLPTLQAHFTEIKGKIWQKNRKKDWITTTSLSAVVLEGR